MNSSTSSSRVSRRARALYIVLTIAAALLCIEWGARSNRAPGTADLSRIFEERARALSASPAPRIAVVGNSVADRVREDVLAGEWRTLTGETPSVEKFVTYYSSLATWRRMSAQIFWKQGRRPDLIVVTYYEGNTLADSEPRDIGNLAQYFTGPEDRASLFAQDLTSFRQRGEYLLASASQAFAGRDRIRDALLHAIPGYRPFVTETNAVEYEYEKNLGGPRPSGKRTFRTLAGFLDDARKAGVTLCFVASPAKPGSGGSYIISRRAKRMIAEAGMLDIDLRRLDGLSADMYSDRIHLNGKGAPIYTRKLAVAINEAMRRQ